MGEVKMRVDVPTEIAQILVGPGWPDLAIKPGLRVLAVPAEAKSVTVGAGRRFERPHALHDQGMRGRGHVLFQRNGIAAIGNPAAHDGAPMGCGAPGGAAPGIPASTTL